jgi:hypothetical protein
MMNSSMLSAPGAEMSRRAAERLAVMLDRFLNGPTRLLKVLVDRSFFTPMGSDAFETYKLDIVRIAVGAILVWRTGAIAFASVYYFDPRAAGRFLEGVNLRALIASGEVLLALGLMLGLLTPLMSLSLLLTYNVFDDVMLTRTLGTNVLTLLLLGLFGLNAGRTFSVDRRFLAAKAKEISRPVRRLYELIGDRTPEERRGIYFLMFVSLAMIHLGAVQYHLQDEYWLNGNTCGVMLTNAFLCRFYKLFRWAEAASPGLYRCFSAAGVACQTVFQTSMIPLLFWRPGKYFVVFWSFVFALISLLFLQLSYLPFLEMAMCVLLFVDQKTCCRLQDWLATKEWISARLTSSAQSDGLSFTPFHRWWVYPIYAWIQTIGLAGLVLCFPLYRQYVGYPSSISSLKRAIYYLGMDIPIVFNREDLALDDNWFVLHRVDPTGSETLVPFLGPEGERRSYLLSDVLYFGNALRWRRGMIDREVIEVNREGYYRELIERVARFDYGLHGLMGCRKYRVEFFRTRSSRVATPLPERYARRRIHEFFLDVGCPPINASKS